MSIGSVSWRKTMSCNKVAEVELEKKIQLLLDKAVITRYEGHDIDGYPDFSIWLPDREEKLKIEVKNVRDANDAYRRNGMVVGYKVEVQKTRAAKGDPSSRYYDRELFQILSVCLGKKTGNWDDFMFVKVGD